MCLGRSGRDDATRKIKSTFLVRQVDEEDDDEQMGEVHRALLLRECQKLKAEGLRSRDAIVKQAPGMLKRCWNGGGGAN